MSRAVWNAVLPYLCQTRRVIAFDIAGFGETPALPGGTPPTLVNLVDSLGRSIRALGINEPVDIGGSSLGGLMALEAARRGLARSVVAISPPGLWRIREAPHVKYVFGTMRYFVRSFPTLAGMTMRRPLLRELALAVPVSVGSKRMPVQDALRAIDDLATATAFEATFEHTRTPFTAETIPVPVTVAFGTRDWILTKRSRDRAALPAHTRWIEQPGWGHVPMWIDPIGVSRLILDGTA